MTPIVVEHRRTLFSEKSDLRTFAPGATVADIVAALPVPVEFATFGAVYLKRSADDPGHIVERRHWRRVRPKPGTALFVSCVPQGGGSKAKNVFTIIAAIALVALTVWVGGGGLAFLGPAFAAGTIGANVAAAAIAVAGSAALQMLTKPPGIGTGASGGEAEAPQLGVAGISRNPISPFRQVPVPLGKMRISPPLLARPFTTVEATDQFVHLICGVCGPAEISNIKINEADLADFSAEDIEVETREGWPDDPQIALIGECGFEESVNLEMGRHRLESDQESLISPVAESYPSTTTVRSLDNADRFRLLLSFPQGLARFDSATQRVLMAFRIRLRRVGDVTWRNLPEMHMEAAIRAPFRQAITFFFGRAREVDLAASLSGQTPVFQRFYAQNPEWTADTYFNAAPSSIDTAALHTFAGTNDVFVYLDPAEWPRGAYDVSIQRSFVQDENSGEFSSGNYIGGLFTYRTAGPPTWSIVNQANYSTAAALESYTTFRARHPIAQPGLALIAVKAKNIRINAISAEFEPYVPVWDGNDWDTVAPSSNPAALVRWVRTGGLNKRPSDPALAAGLEDFYAYCDDKGLSCHAVVEEGSVEQAAALAANVGDAIIRESDRWGVVIDRDRSDEGIHHLFGAHNMTSPLVIQRKFVFGTRGIVPQFTDASREYALRELSQPVYDDGVSRANDDMLVEAVPYDGYADEMLVRRRAKLDVRRARLRATRYSWECNQEHLVAMKGDLVGLSHDILAYVFGSGRIAAFTTEAGSPSDLLRTVTLNTEVEDLPDWDVAGMFEVPDVFLVGDMFHLSAPELGLQVRLADNAIAMLPVASVDGAVITLDDDVPVPAGFGRTLLAAVGPRTRIVRRVLLTNITPRRDHVARLEAVDEAPAIHRGL